MPDTRTAASPRAFAQFVRERLRMGVACELGDREKEAREAAQQSLRVFIEQAWPIVEPRRDFVPNWHIDALCEHLEAVTRGDIQNLLINVPPGTGKSLEMVFWMCWSWTTQPWSRWLCASYADKLSTRDSLKCRRIISSAWYQTRWPDASLRSDANEKTRFENISTGYRISTSVTGRGTGERGDYSLIDDAHKVQEAESDSQRQGVIDWHDQEWFNRVDEHGRRVVLGQRVHQTDLPGHIIEDLDGWEHLCLPMEYEATPRPRSKANVPCVTSIGWKDPRTVEGELLWPARYDQAECDKLRRTLGSVGWATQYQQAPSPREGALFKVNQLLYIDSLAELGTGEHKVRVVASARGWDKAGTEGGGKYSAGVRIDRLSDGRFLVSDVERGQWSALAREQRIRACAERDGRACRVRVEQEPGSGGKESAESTVRSLAGWDVEAVRSVTNKEARATPFAIQVEAGNVILLRRDWTDTFVNELRLFPNGTYTDQGDASAEAFNEVTGPKGVTPAQLYGEGGMYAPNTNGKGNGAAAHG